MTSHENALLFAVHDNKNAFDNNFRKKYNNFYLVFQAIIVCKRIGLFLVTQEAALEEKKKSRKWWLCSKEILTAMRVMVVSIGSRGSHIPAMTPRRLRRGVIAGM